MNYIGRTLSLHFLTGTELHRNGEVHGGSMNHIGTTSSLHFLIRSKLHHNGEVHGGSMNYYFSNYVFISLLFFFSILLLIISIKSFFFFQIVFQLLFFPNSLQAWGSNLLTADVDRIMAQFWPSARR